MKILTALRSDTLGRCSKNVWLSFLVELFVVMLNYRTWLIPSWLVAFIVLVIVCYSLISFYGYVYWLINQWHSLEVETRLLKSLYWTLLGVVTLLSIYILLKVYSAILH